MQLIKVADVERTVISGANCANNSQPSIILTLTRNYPERPLHLAILGIKDAAYKC